MKTDLRYIEIGKKEGKLMLGGERLTGGAYDRGYFVPPTIFDHVAPDSTIAQEEIFGPVLSVIRVRNFGEALHVANSVRYGLSSSLYSNDAAKIFEFIDRIETGITHVNSPTVAASPAAFGGNESHRRRHARNGPRSHRFLHRTESRLYRFTGRKRESNIY